ncbi:MAG: RICIN domain-containing protein, partial [Clostridium sp.]|nr:RICIN domain-containing protein [Clostridium sp.]
MKKKIKFIIIALCFFVIITISLDVYAISTLNNTTNELENSINNEVSNKVENGLRELILNNNKEETTKEKTNDVDNNITTYNTSNVLGNNGVYRLAVGADSNKVIEIAGSNTDDNAKVDIWAYGNVPAQKFNIEYVDEGYYKITA